MYNYPYGDNQQINLNWIISEIIALHQRLDPDYTAPTFTQIYPFSDTQQLNLDWILTELKALKDLAPTPPPTEEIDEIEQALIAGAYDATTSYQKNDYIVQDGKLYRANAATTGTFDPTKWNDVMLGDDLAIITRWADATNTYLNNLAASNVANDSSVKGARVKDALNNLNGAINELQEVNILVVGNSFNQDMMAYLPPIMNEALPEFKFNWCLLYEGSSDFDTHIQMFIDGTKYTYTNIWEVGDTAWHRYGKTDANGMTLKQALAYKHWDMVFMQATTSDVQTEALIQTKVITAGRRLMRAVAAYASAPFTFYTFEWLARPNNSSSSDPDSEINSNYALIHKATIETVQALGFRDYVPVGTAFQNARTNSTIKALGTGASMLYSDNVHAQAGAPALLGNYVVAAFLCNICGKPNGIINSSFHPSTDIAIAINARTSNNPVGMTHGASSTITNPVKRAIQEIAYITLNNPSHITDCSNIVVNTPT